MVIVAIAAGLAVVATVTAQLVVVIGAINGVAVRNITTTGR